MVINMKKKNSLYLDQTEIAVTPTTWSNSCYPTGQAYTIRTVVFEIQIRPKWKAVLKTIDCEQSLFCSKIRGEKVSEHESRVSGEATSSARVVSRRAHYSRVTRARILSPRGFSSKRETAHSLSFSRQPSILGVFEFQLISKQKCKD